MCLDKVKVLLLCGEHRAARIIYNNLKSDFDFSCVVMESKVPWRIFLWRRVKSLGLIKVFGQILFQIFVIPVLNLVCQKRSREIYNEYGLDESPIEPHIVKRVDSVNDSSVTGILREYVYDVVLISGTRILKKDLLDAAHARIINIHSGITPLYRGVHGGYWSLVEKDKENCGVTVHLVDKGIDTGGILGQKVITPNNRDSFVTYTLLQLGEGIPLLKEKLSEVAKGLIVTIEPPEGNSQLWTHPTIFSYLFNWIKRGVR